MLRLVVNTQLSEGKDLLCSTLCFIFFFFCTELVFKIGRFLFLLPFLSFLFSPVLFSSQLHVCQLGISLNEISL